MRTSSMVSWKRQTGEVALSLATIALPRRRLRERSPRSIFVLRNNDIGDLLVITPLFEALRRRFPQAAIVAGVGTWNVDVLRDNPHVSEIVPVNAPWHNRVTGTRNPWLALKYVARSPELRALRARHFDVGIDVLGSLFGSLLLLRAGVAWRLGVRGYAGGHTAAHACIEYDRREHVGRAALRFAELLGATELPSTRPQIFLSPGEEAEGERTWQACLQATPGTTPRVVIAPGGSHEGRRWPLDAFAALVRRLLAAGCAPVIVGGPADDRTGERIVAVAGGAANLTGRLTLRQTFSVIAKADVVLCNSSMAMHAAAAFGVPAVVLLGPAYPSAREHAAQWGHGALSLVLGPEPNRPRVSTPEEAWHAMTAWTVPSLFSRTTACGTC